MKIDVTHIVWPWIADRAGFFWTRFEVGRDGKTANERLKVKSAKVQGISFAEGVLRVGGPLGKSTCMWEDGVYLGIEEITGGGRREEQKHSVANVLKRTAPDKWERSGLDMIAIVPWCKNEDDEKRDVERHEEETVLMDIRKTSGKMWIWKNMPPVP